MAQPLTTPSNRPTGATIPGASAEAGITRTIATPGSTPREETGAMRYVLTSCVALAAMTAAALAEPPSPTRLSESQLDTITAGLNIDTPNFAIQTGCNPCYSSTSNSVPGGSAGGFAVHYNYKDPTDTGWVANYAGPLGLLGVGAAGGGGVSYFDARAVGSSGGGAGEGSVNDGQGFALGVRGPVGILSVGAAAAVGGGIHSTEGGAGNNSALSLNGLGGTLKVPVGSGNEAVFSLRAGIGAPGL